MLSSNLGIVPWKTSQLCLNSMTLVLDGPKREKII
jgi:hypothetical protein